MNTIDKYNEIKNILLGCRNINDAKFLSGLYLKKNPESKKLVCSLLYGKIYFDCYDFKVFNEMMKKINECEYQENCDKLINEFFPPKNNNNINNNNNNAQLKTLTRILNNKKKESEKKTILGDKINPIHEFLTPPFFNKNNYIKKTKQNEYIKYCPHCSDKYIGSESTTHVICGYNDSHTGYNWTGCQKDWCFTCGKKLCKSWNENKLYLEPNRIHNSECCKQYAANKCEPYNNYCQCNNKYVNRNRK
jgi:hypothetical protein